MKNTNEKRSNSSSLCNRKIGNSYVYQYHQVINFRSKLIMLVRKILTGLSGKLRQRKSRIFLRLSFWAMRKVCVYSVCMADAQNPLTVPAILVSGQARCRCRRQNTGRTDRTLCRGVCGRFSGRYYEPVRKSLSNMERQLIHSPFDTKNEAEIKEVFEKCDYLGSSFSRIWAISAASLRISCRSF